MRDRMALTAGQAGRGDVDRRDVDPDLVQCLARLAAHQRIGQKRDRRVHLLAAQEQVLAY